MTTAGASLRRKTRQEAAREKITETEQEEVQKQTVGLNRTQLQKPDT